MNRDEIEQIKEIAGVYATEALRSRKAFLELRLRQDPEIRKIFVRAAAGISALLQKGGSLSVGGRMLAAIERQLTQTAEQLRGDLGTTLGEHLETAVNIGSRFNRAVTIDLLTNRVRLSSISKAGLERMYFRVNEEAVRACWERTFKGLKLSNRIWNTSKEATNVMTHIVQDAVARGQDAVQTARLLERYVKEDANVLTKHYTGMMERMQGRIPDNISYQALRMARTETTAALGLGTIRSAQASPSCVGIKFCLSPSHRIRDICDELASRNVGLGSGVYPLHDPPPYPAHPNTHSYLIEVHQSTDDFVDQLMQWMDDPGSQPGINQWYEEVYEADR